MNKQRLNPGSLGCRCKLIFSCCFFVRLVFCYASSTWLYYCSPLHFPDGRALWQASELVDVHDQFAKSFVGKGQGKQHIHVFNLVALALNIVKNLFYWAQETLWFVRPSTFHVAKVNLSHGKKTNFFAFISMHLSIFSTLRA